ncbi:MAG: hypothetical protein ACRDU9_05815, partial [Acidimicrobiia bacterium]
LHLLRDLTAKYPSWSVWKNPESAFSGPGDIDSLAPPAVWDDIEQTFREWADSYGLSPVIVCRHVPQGPHFIAIDPEWPHMLILDVKKCSTWRGSTLIDHRQLQEVSIIGDQGFRRVRPGAEGVLKLLLNGTLKGGKPNPEGLEGKGVIPLLESDPEGVELASRWMGPLSGTLRSAVDTLLQGGWDRRSMVAIEAWAVLRSLKEPRTAVSRLVFNRYTLPRCQILRSVRYDHRRVPDDRETWIEEISVDHEVDVVPTS